MAARRWWDERVQEIYWVEITDRDDLGVDLAAPRLNEDGNPYWSYDLVREVCEGDAILHYYTPEGAFTHWSRAVGQPYEDELVWGAHGQASGRGPVQPYRRPAWRRPLDGPYELSSPVGLQDLQRSERHIRHVMGRLRDEHGRRPLYPPLQLSDRRPLRAFQAYMAKMPRDLLLAVPELSPLVPLIEKTRPTPERPAPRSGRKTLGSTYRAVNEEVVTRPDRDPHWVDPNLIDRALRSHARIQNLLARAVETAGHDPRSPEPGKPSFDLAWEDGDTICIAEMKSTSGTNEEKQLRLALGQVLRYAHLIAGKGRPTRTFIAVEREPRDRTWIALCDELGVRLCWPETFQAAVES